MPSPHKLDDIELPAIDQVGYVVNDLDQAMSQYKDLFGPFEIMETPLQGALYRGQPEDVTLRIAFGDAGGIQMEFIEVVSGTSPHSEFLARGREGIHHIRYKVEDVDAIIKKLEARNYQTIWYHDIGFAKWAYCEDQTRDGMILEFLQM